MSNKPTTVEARFICREVKEDAEFKQQWVSMDACVEEPWEDFGDATPGGDTSLLINTDYPAAGFFEKGQTYAAIYIPVEERDQYYLVKRDAQ